MVRPVLKNVAGRFYCVMFSSSKHIILYNVPRSRVELKVNYIASEWLHSG